jgi:hypothetical protein
MMFVSLLIYLLIVHRTVSYDDVKLQSYVHVFLCSVMMCRQRSYKGTTHRRKCPTEYLKAFIVSELLLKRNKLVHVK